MYTYEDREKAEKQIEVWTTSKKEAQEQINRINLVLPVLKKAIEEGKDTYVGPESGLVRPITQQHRDNITNGVYDKSIVTFEKKIKQADEYIEFWENVKKEYDAGVQRKEEIKTVSPEITPVVNVNVPPVIPQIKSPCDVTGLLGGNVGDVLGQVGKVIGTINAVDQITQMSKSDPLGALAAASGLLGLETFKKTEDFLNNLQSKVNSIKGPTIPTGPISEISKAINEANSKIQNSIDCVNTAISSTIGAVNAGANQITSKVNSSVNSLNSSIDSISSLTGNTKSYKSVRSKISNPVVQLPKDIAGIANKMNDVSNIAQMSAGLANNVLNDVSSLVNASKAVISGDTRSILAGASVLSQAETIVDKTTGSVKNVKSLLQNVTK